MFLRLLLLLVSFCPLNLFAFEGPFRWEVRPSVEEVKPGESFSVEVVFSIPENHYLYQDKTVLEPPASDELRWSRLETPPALTEKDPFFGKEVKIYRNEAVIRGFMEFTPNATPGKKELLFTVRYQGCSATLCFREQQHEVPVSLNLLSASGEASEPDGEKSFFWRLIAAFIGGVLTDLTPCVLPIIPITLAFIGVRRERKVSHNILLTSLLVLSMSLTYAALGVVGAALGKSLGFLFQGVFFSIVSSLLYFSFALALIGWLPLQAPAFIRNRMARWGGEGPWGSILAGVTVGFLAAPCVGPVIATLLLYIAQSGKLSSGFLLLFSFGLGMGSLFLVLGAFFHSLAGRRFGGTLTLWAKRVMAILLVLPALYYGHVALEQIQSSRQITGSIPEQEGIWRSDPETAFKEAVAEGKPVFIDFFATWCLPCLEMERRTFSQPEVQNFLQENFIPLKVDCTTETPSCQKMIERYQVVGWPTYLIADSKGDVLEMIIGKIINPKPLLSLLKKHTGD